MNCRMAVLACIAVGLANALLASGHAQVKVGKKMEAKYVIAPANYATKALAISVRYLD